MDSIDLEILKALQNDARTDFSSLSKRLSLTPGAVRSRFRKLENEGIIKGSTVDVDFCKLGLIGGHLQVTLKPNSIDDFRNHMGSTVQDKESFDIMPTIEGNAYIYCVVKNFAELTEFINRIKLFQNVIEVKLRMYEEAPVFLPANISIESSVR